jgi:hypothetical protein
MRSPEPGGMEVAPDTGLRFPGYWAEVRSTYCRFRQPSHRGERSAIRQCRRSDSSSKRSRRFRQLPDTTMRSDRRSHSDWNGPAPRSGGVATPSRCPWPAVLPWPKGEGQERQSACFAWRHRKRSRGSCPVHDLEEVSFGEHPFCEKRVWMAKRSMRSGELSGIWSRWARNGSCNPP